MLVTSFISQSVSFFVLVLNIEPGGLILLKSSFHKYSLLDFHEFTVSNWILEKKYTMNSVQQRKLGESRNT